MFSFRKEKNALVPKNVAHSFKKKKRIEKQKPMVGQGVVDKPGAVTDCKCHRVNKND